MDHNQHDPDKKQDLRDLSRHCGNAGQTERSGDQH
jgi:hypothetical protein